MKRVVRASFLAVAIALGVSACSSSSNPDSPSPNAPASTITAGETSQLESAVATAGSPVTNALMQTVLSMTTAGTAQLNTTQACTNGGTAHATGPVVVTVDQAGTTGSISPDTTVTYSKCAVGNAVLDGGPVEIKGTLSVVKSVIQNPVKFTISGSHNFTIDGTTGFVSFSCANNLTVNTDTLTAILLVASGSASIQFPTGHKPNEEACQNFATPFGFGGAAAVFR